MESYLRFQVTGVLGTVQQAKLRLWVTNGTPNGPAAYKTNWAGAETAITWNNRAPRTSGPTDDKGNVPGGRIRGVRRDPARDRQRDEWLRAGRHLQRLPGRLLQGIQHRLTETAADRDRRRQGVDSEPPTAPTGLTAAAAWPTEVDLNWAEATDNVGVTAYGSTATSPAHHGGRRDRTTRT